MQVTFSQTSWHYKFFRYMHGWERKTPENLCLYVRLLLLGVLSIPFKWVPHKQLWIIREDTCYGGYRTELKRAGDVGATIITYIFIWLCFLSGIGATASFFGCFKNPDQLVWWQWLLVLPVGVVINMIWLTVFVAIINFGECVQDKLYERKARKLGGTEPDEPKKSNVIISYIKAKKAKICPIINWKN